MPPPMSKRKAYEGVGPFSTDKRRRWSCRRPLSVGSDSRRYEVRLGGHSTGEDSFPLTEVPHLDPALRMFRAALTSRSCHSPQCAHSQRLTASCLRPLGPLRAPQLEQLREVFRSLTTWTVLPAHSPLYCKNRLSVPQPESNTDFAIRVFASFRLLTSPTTIV